MKSKCSHHPPPKPDSHLFPGSGFFVFPDFSGRCSFLGQGVSKGKHHNNRSLNIFSTSSIGNPMTFVKEPSIFSTNSSPVS